MVTNTITTRQPLDARKADAVADLMLDRITARPSSA